MISRREFLNRTAGSIAAAGSIASFASEVYGKPLGMPIGSQVYPHSSRIKEGDFVGLLKDMKDIGIEQIELDSPDYPNCVSLADGKQTRKIMDDHGIKCPSVHFTMNELRTKMPHVIEWAHQVGAMHVSTATLAGKSEAGKTTTDEVKRAADEFNKIGAAVAKGGMKTTLHDEIFEMAKVEDGSLVYTHLIDLLDPKTVFFQFQISSLRVVGDPIMYFNKFPGRFISMHLQGVDVNAPLPPPPVAGPGGRATGGRGRGPQLAVGHDTLDWKAIFTAARKGGLENYFVEQSWDLTVQSVSYLKTLNV
jgi:sugar phosphate isomerase/epimerase